MNTVASPLSPLVRCLVLALLLAFTSGCTSARKHVALLASHHALQRSCQEREQALRRESDAAYAVKLEQEKEIALLQNRQENTEGRLRAEKEAHASYRTSTGRKVADLEQRLENTREKNTRKEESLLARQNALTDSLMGQIDTLSAALTQSRRSHAAEVNTLKNELARRKFAYEKELYALDKMKEELFGRLEQKEGAGGISVPSPSADTINALEPR